jgi:hypothetical protein
VRDKVWWELEILHPEVCLILLWDRQQCDRQDLLLRELIQWVRKYFEVFYWNIPSCLELTTLQFVQPRQIVLDAYRSIFWNEQLSFLKTGFTYHRCVRIEPNLHGSFLARIILFKSKEHSSISRKLTLYNLLYARFLDGLCVQIFWQNFCIKQMLREAMCAHISIASP